MKGLSLLLILIPVLSFASLKEFLPKAFKADFIQVTKSSINKGKKKVSKGKIEYLFPGNVRFEMKDPSNIIVVNPNEMYYYRPPFIDTEKGDLDIYTSGGHAITKFFDSLKNGLISNRLYQVETKKKMSSLSFLTSYAKTIGFKGAKILFRSPKYSFKNISQINLHKNNGKVVVYKFNKIFTMNSISKKRFSFEAPPNTRVQKH